MSSTLNTPLSFTARREQFLSTFVDIVPEPHKRELIGAIAGPIADDDKRTLFERMSDAVKDALVSTTDVLSMDEAQRRNARLRFLMKCMVDIIDDLAFHIESERIWREIEDMTPEQVTELLNKEGIDAKASAERFRKMLKALMEKDGTTQEPAP